MRRNRPSTGSGATSFEADGGIAPQHSAHLCIRSIKPPQRTYIQNIAPIPFGFNIITTNLYIMRL